MGILIQDPTGECVYANEAAAQLHFYPSATALVGAHASEILMGLEITDESGVRVDRSELLGSEALRGGGPQEKVLRVRDPVSDREAWMVVTAHAIRDDQQRPQFAVVMLRDITALKRTQLELLTRAREGKPVAAPEQPSRDGPEDHRTEEALAELLSREETALAEARAAQARLSFLAEAGAALSGTLDLEAALKNLAGLAVGFLADICFVDLIEDSGSIRRIADARSGRAQQRRLDEWVDRYPPDPHGQTPAARVIRTGRSELRSEMSEGFLRQMAKNEEELRMVQGLAFRSYVCAPLAARGRVLGCLTLITTEAADRYGPADVELVEDLARRAALAIDNARLFEDQRHIAHTLQASLLSPSLPAIGGIEVAARYLAAGEGTEVGGDFYDVYKTRGGSWAAVIGDVCGKGPEAATVTGMARHALRAITRTERRPSRVLAGLNDAIMEARTDQRFCTVCYARVRPNARGARVTICSGGHPLPLLVGMHSTIRAVGQPGTLLGIFPDVQLTDQRVDLRRGEVLLMYTDGVTEAKAGDEAFGIPRLEKELRACASRGASGIVASVERSVLEFAGGPLADDMALLALRVVANRRSEHVEPAQEDPHDDEDDPGQQTPANQGHHSGDDEHDSDNPQKGNGHAVDHGS